MASPRILVIGGGPAGLAAAISATRAGASVIVADRMDRVGKKLLASGNGRCNLSNAFIGAANYHGAGAVPALSILGKYEDGFIRDFFRSVGVLTVYDGESRLYPGTYSSATVLNALRCEAARLGVVEAASCKAVSISRAGGVFETRFRSVGVRARTLLDALSGAAGPRFSKNAALIDGRPADDPAENASAGGVREQLAFISDRVIVAAGGMSAPSLGSDGSGYGLLTALGHRLIAPAPALAQLCLSAGSVRGLKGVRAQAGIALYRASDIRLPDAAPLYRETGELLFTDYGISGIPALNLSCRLAPYINGKAKPDKAVRPFLCPGFIISIDLFPEYSAEEIAGFLADRLEQWPLLPEAELLCGILHKQIAARVTETVINKDQKNGPAPGYASRLASALKDWRHGLDGVMGFDNSQVTYGGLSFGDFYEATLESRIEKGLYAAGEILDVAGECGGYNLHWAFVSGYHAGKCAASGGSI